MTSPSPSRLHKLSQSEAFKFARSTFGVSLGISAMVLVLGLLGNVVNEADVLATRRFEAKFSHIKPGIHRVEVVRVLGKPDYQTDRFYLGKRADFEQEYTAAEASGSAYFLVWYRDSDAIFTVGFSDFDIVTFQAAGRK